MRPGSIIEARLYSIVVEFRQDGVQVAQHERRRVRFITAAALVNQLAEALRDQSLTRILARWSNAELIVIDKLGYVPLAEVAAELLFQVIADHAEKAAVIVTTNLPFSEWSPGTAGKLSSR